MGFRNSTPTFGQVPKDFLHAQHTSSVLLVLRPKCGLRVGKCVLGWTHQSTRASDYPGLSLGFMSVPSSRRQEPGVWGWDESAKHNCSLSGTKEMRSWAALAWHLGTQEQVGTEVISCELQALGSGWSTCLPPCQGYWKRWKREGEPPGTFIPASSSVPDLSPLSRGA